MARSLELLNRDLGFVREQEDVPVLVAHDVLRQAVKALGRMMNATLPRRLVKQ